MKPFESHPHNGFALIAALLAIVILTALGILVFSVTNQDIRISSRLVGEKKAFSAAEAGIHHLMINFDGTNPGATQSDVPIVVDAANNTGSQFRISRPAPPERGPKILPMPGMSLNLADPNARMQYRFVTTVTGENTRHNSQVQIDLGIGYGPVNPTSNQP